MKNSIDEFILNDIDPDKGLKGKSITLIAISIVILFIIIIISRSIFSPSSQKVPPLPINSKGNSQTTVTKKVSNIQKDSNIIKPSNSQKTSEAMYYIQVGTFKQDPSSRLLSIIKSSGYKYVVGEYKKTGTKRVLIGPYDNTSNAKKDLSTIKIRIADDAYITKTKVN